MKGLVILPVYNDFSKLKSLISKIHLDIIIIDDGSKKNIKPFLSGLNYNKLISYNLNKGKGHALRKGFGYAIQNGYDYVITMDSDGEHNPDDIKKFVKSIKSCDLVIGERKIYRSLLRTLLNYIGGISFRFLIPGLHDTQSGFRAIRTDILKKIELVSDRFEIETEILLEAYKIKSNFKMISIKSNPIKHSNVTLNDYLKINDLFDRWVLKNKNNLRINFIKRFVLMILVSGGIFSSWIFRRLK